MARGAKVSEEEIERYFIHLMVNTKTTIPLRVGEERRFASRYISNYSIVVYTLRVEKAIIDLQR